MEQLVERIEYLEQKINNIILENYIINLKKMVMLLYPIY